jgi:histidine phosphotransferase ChpT
MSGTIEFRVLELLNARLCHELVSPIGAINNGVELLDDDDPDFVRDAIRLIGQSARKAGQRLQFYRFAYGTTTSSGGSAAGNGGDLAAGLLEGGKVRCDWPAEAVTLPVDWQRLACNMLVLAAEALPRGGTVLVRPLHGGASGIEVAAEGESVNLSPEMRAALDPGATVEQLTSRTVHAYFTARLASQLGAGLALAEAAPQRALFRAAAG